MGGRQRSKRVGSREIVVTKEVEIVFRRASSPRNVTFEQVQHAHNVEINAGCDAEVHESRANSALGMIFLFSERSVGLLLFQGGGGGNGW